MKFLLLLFLILKVNSKIVLQPESHGCHIELTLLSTLYFKGKECISVVNLSNETNDALLHQMEQMKMVFKLGEGDIKFKESSDMKKRRVDDLYPDGARDGVITKYCPESYGSFLIIVTNTSEFARYSFGLEVSPFITTDSKFLVHINEDIQIEEVEDVSRRIWNYFKTPNIIFVDETCSIFRYSPFVKNGEDWGKVEKKDLEQVKNDPKLLENDLEHLNNHPLKVALFLSLTAFHRFHNDTYVVFGGMEAELLEVLSKYMNFELVIPPDIPPADYGTKRKDGSFKGCLKRLLEGEYDFISTTYFIKYYFTYDIEFSAVGLGDDLCVLIRNSDVMPLLEVLAQYYKVWAVLFISFIIQALTWKLVKKFETKFVDPKRNRHSYTFLDTLRLIVASSFSRAAHLDSERIFLIFSMFGTIIFLGAFQGSLINIFSEPVRYPAIDTLEKLSKTDYKIYTHFEDLQYDVFGTENTTNPVTKKLRQMVVLVGKHEDIDHKVGIRRNFGGLIRKSTLDLSNKTR